MTCGIHSCYFCNVAYYQFLKDDDGERTTEPACLWSGIYRVGQKVRPQTYDLILSNLDQFKKNFTGRFLGKFVVKRILKIQTHLAYMLLHYLVKH